MREGGQCPPVCFQGKAGLEKANLIFETAVHGISTDALQRFARKARALARITGEVDILISNNKRLRELNRRFRHKNKPTDVLSFPRSEGGDIAISADIARKNAALYGHGITEEIKILVLHGMLHLAGHDHETDNGRMARLEARLRFQLKLPASLIDRTHSSADQSLSAARHTHLKKRKAATPRTTAKLRRTSTKTRRKKSLRSTSKPSRKALARTAS